MMNHTDQNNSSRFGRRDFRNILILLILASILFLFRLGERGLADPEEGRYGEIAREMVESGDWVTPRLNYIKRFHKPPLIFWKTAAVIKIFGLGKVEDRLPGVMVQPFKFLFTGRNDLIDEFAIRLLPACAAVLTVVGVYLLGRLLFNRPIGFMSGLVLMTAPQFFALGHILNTDMELTCLTVFSFLFFIHAVSNGGDGRLCYNLLFFLTLALGVLTKGFIIFITAVIPILIYSIVIDKSVSLRRLKLLPGILLFLAVSLPWYVVVCLQNNGLLRYFLFQQSLSRAYATTFRGAEPIWFFIPVLVAGFTPWIVFALYSFIKHLNFKIKSLGRDQSRLLLLFFWFAVPFILFSVFPSKLMTYTLPLIPPLAIFVAYGFFHLLTNETHYCKRFSRCFLLFGLAIVTILLGIAVIYFGFKFLPKFDFSFQYIIITAALVFDCGLLCMIAYVYRKRYFLFGTIFVSFFALLITLKFLAADIDRNLHWRVRGKMFSETILSAGGKDDTVIMCGRSLPSVPFYLRKRIITVNVVTEALFEVDRKILERYIYSGIDNLPKLLDSDERVFCIIKRDEFDKLEPDAYHVIDETKNLLLISNRQSR